MKPIVCRLAVASILAFATTSGQAQASPDSHSASMHGHDHVARCSDSDIRGTYRLVTNGTNVAAGRLSAAVGIFVADGAGNLAGNVTTSDNGAIFRGSFTGTYVVNSDCTGSVEIPGGSFTQADAVIDPGGDSLHLIVTNTGAVITGVAERLKK